MESSISIPVPTISYNLIKFEELGNIIKDVLDSETQKNLLELKEYSKFVNQFKSPFKIRHKYNNHYNTDLQVDKLFIFKQELQSFLNKITDANFFSTSQKISNMINGTPEHIQAVIEILFEKSCAEPLYTSLYGRLVNVLVADFPIFKDELVEHCQEYINRNLSKNTQSIGTISENSNNYDELCEHIKEKSRFIGAYVFIGVLYLNSMLSNQLFIEYLDSLWHYINNSSQEYLEKYVDGLSSLLSMVYMKLHKDLGWDIFKSNVIEPIEKLKNDKSRLKGKLRFKVLDLYEKLMTSPEDILDGWKRV